MISDGPTRLKPSLYFIAVVATTSAAMAKPSSTYPMRTSVHMMRTGVHIEVGTEPGGRHGCPRPSPIGRTRAELSPQEAAVSGPFRYGSALRKGSPDPPWSTTVSTVNLLIV
ncbi:hypothetical protein GCM10027075_65570 [Streptomyces heilongjiangensis]